MSPQPVKSTDTTSEAQGRFTVALSKDTGKLIDQLIRDTAETLRKTIGVGVEISRAQMVQTLVQDALRQRAERNGNAAPEAPAAS